MINAINWNPMINAINYKNKIGLAPTPGLPHILADKIPGLFQDFSRTICQISRSFMVFEKLDECSCLSEECMFASLPYISNI